MPRAVTVHVRNGGSAARAAGRTGVSGCDRIIGDVTGRRPRRGRTHRDLGMLMRTGYHRTMEYVQARLEQLGFDGVRPAHMAIFQNLGPEGARIGELAERTKLANQSVGYLVDYLEEHGYVERRPDPANRRATLVCFTERGWDEADACAEILGQLD